MGNLDNGIDNQHNNVHKPSQNNKTNDSLWAIILPPVGAATSFFAIGHGVLSKIAPPYSATFNQPIGADFAQIFVIIIILATYAFSPRSEEGKQILITKWRGRAVMCGIFAIAIFVLYLLIYNNYTFVPLGKNDTPADRLCVGWHPIVPTDKTDDNRSIFSGVGNILEDGWNRSEITEVKTILVLLYVAFSLLVASCMFMFAEIIRLLTHPTKS